jgi:hypothetical protein
MLALRSLSNDGLFHERPEESGRSHGGAPMGHANAINQAEDVNVFWQCLAYKYRTSAFAALVVAEFWEPSVTPVLGALSFPDDCSACLTNGSANTLQSVSAVRSFSIGSISS